MAREHFFSILEVMITPNGHEALKENTIGRNNSANGGNALFSNTTGNNNTANGFETLTKNTVGINNSANGARALFSNTGGNRNTANGYAALYSNSMGSFNTAIGNSALYNNSSGDSNTALGDGALLLVTTGSNNIGVGQNSNVPNSAASNQVRIGNTNITYAGIQVGWTITSDARWKKEVKDLPYGLNMVSQLRPVDYIRKNNENETREIGFIAQEVEMVLAQLGYDDQGILTKDDEGFMSLRYNDFIPVLTKAIQEQQEIITSLKNEQKTMLSLVMELKTQMAELKGQNNSKEVSLRN